MAKAWVVNNYQLAATYGASLTKQPISKSIPIRDGGVKLVVDIKVSNVTVTTGITAFIQDSSDGFTTVNNKKSVSITADGTFSITLLAQLAGDQTHLPLRNAARIVLDTGAGDTVDVDEIRVCKAE